MAVESSSHWTHYFEQGERPTLRSTLILCSLLIASAAGLGMLSALRQGSFLLQAFLNPLYKGYGIPHPAITSYLTAAVMCVG